MGGGNGRPRARVCVCVQVRNRRERTEGMDERYVNIVDAELRGRETVIASDFAGLHGPMNLTSTYKGGALSERERERGEERIGERVGRHGERRSGPTRTPHTLEVCGERRTDRTGALRVLGCD